MKPGPQINLKHLFSIKPNISFVGETTTSESFNVKYNSLYI